MFDQTFSSNILLHEQMFDLLGVSVKRWAGAGMGKGGVSGSLIFITFLSFFLFLFLYLSFYVHFSLVFFFFFF